MKSFKKLFIKENSVRDGNGNTALESIQNFNLWMLQCGFWFVNILQ